MTEMANRVVQYSSPSARHVRGTRVEIGDTLYAVQDKETRLYFIWSYTDRAMAEYIADRIRCGHNRNPHVNRATDIAANWRRDKAQLTPSTARGKAPHRTSGPTEPRAERPQPTEYHPMTEPRKFEELCEAAGKFNDGLFSAAEFSAYAIMWLCDAEHNEIEILTGHLATGVSHD